MDAASADAVSKAVKRSTVWPVDLAPDPRFVPVSELVAGGLAHRIRNRLGDPPPRVAESAVVMGLASRLWSVSVVTSARSDLLVDDSALVASDEQGALVLGLAETRGWLAPTVDDVDAMVRRVLDPVIASLDLAPRLLWGNVAASLHAVPRVHELPEARRLVGALLDRPPYRGEVDELSGGRARRRTCCLFYLVEGAGVCGDCVFDQSPLIDSETVNDERQGPLGH